MPDHEDMDVDRTELDATRSAIADRGLVGVASGFLTTDVAMALPFEALGPFKEYLKRFFSHEPWTDADAFRLSDLVTPHTPEGVSTHAIDDDITLTHGVVSGTYILQVSGVTERTDSVFDRVFEGPVLPEATPHPRKVKFATGGTASPGVWYRRTDPPTDDRVARLFEEDDVTDVMVAGDFVTVGITTSSSWEERLEPLLALVTELFWTGAGATAPARTREELMQEAADLGQRRAEELHLLDPDDPGHRARLLAAMEDDDARVRRVAVAILAESSSAAVRSDSVRRGFLDHSRVVRRTSIDAAADTEDEGLRDLFEEALGADDEWIRWKAVRALRRLGLGPSRPEVEHLADDPDFQVRLEVAAALR